MVFGADAINNTTRVTLLLWFGANNHSEITNIVQVKKRMWLTS